MPTTIEFMVFLADYLACSPAVVGLGETFYKRFLQMPELVDLSDFEALEILQKYYSEGPESLAVE